MITLRFEKQLAMRYVSHIDLLRHIERTMRRAGVPVAFSQGFNPHMQLNLGVPLPVGVGSVCEYVTVDTEVDPHYLLTVYNRTAPKGLRALQAWRTLKHPNMAGKTVAATYTMAIRGENEVLGALAKLPERQSWVIAYPSRKNPTATRDVAAGVFGIQIADGLLRATLASGNVTVRPDLFAEALMQEFGVEIDLDSILRTAQYVRGQDGGLLSADTYLSNV